MLVLSRRPGQKVLFPSLQASVQVVSARGNVVRLGIEAPPGLTILREELVTSGVARLAPHGFPSPAGRTAPDPQEQSDAARRLAAACAELAALTASQRRALAPEDAAALARIEEDLGALRRRLDATPPTPARRALLVEDNANERELLATFLRMSGVSVDTAGDGADALDYLRSHERPDVILLDMSMPRCDGPTAVRAIRHDPTLSGVKIMAVTGHRAEEFDLPAGPGGVDRWFQKPIEPADLVRELEQELRARRRA